MKKKMVNNVVLVGRLTKDVSIRMTPSGKKVCSFTLAVDRRKSQDPTQPTADFINCVVWERGAEILQQYTHKGSQIAVQGSIQTRNYLDPNYTDRTVYVTEVLVNNVTLLGGKEQNTAPVVEVAPADDYLSIDMDDLPF